MDRKVALAAGAAALLAVGFVAGYSVGLSAGRQKADSQSATERLARMLIEEAERNRPAETRQRVGPESLQEASVKHLAKDMKKLEDTPKGE